MKSNSNGPRIIIGMVVVVAIALIGLIVPTLLSQFKSASSGNVAPAAVVAQGTAVSLPSISRTTAGSSAARGRVRTSPVPETTIVTSAKAQNTTPLATGNSSSPLAIDVISATYTPSGKPSSGCSQIDNNTPGQRFDFVINVVNHTGVNLGAGDWGAQAYSGDKALALCYFGQTAQLPVLVNDAKTLVNLVAFTDVNEPVTTVVLGTTSGFEARTCFSEGKVVACK